MKTGGPIGKIIGGTGLLAIATWGISEGRLPTTNQMIGDIDVAETPRLFWAYILNIGAVGPAGLIWGLITNIRRKYFVCEHPMSWAPLVGLSAPSVNAQAH